jgi:restriction endonuclease S subunit
MKRMRHPNCRTLFEVNILKIKIGMSSLKDVADIKFCIVKSSQAKEQSEKAKWLMASNLLQDNVIIKILEDEKYIKDDSLRVFKNDIVVKRISPSYITYIDQDLPNIYAYNNLILVRAKEIYAKYLASVLSYKIKELSLNTSIGAVIPSIGRTELENLQIPICSPREQELIGEIWYKSIEKKKMLIRLAELESSKENYLINNFINNKVGGKQ